MPESFVLPRRTSLPHQVPSWVQEGSVFFITINCRPRGLDQLCNTDTAKVIFESCEHRSARLDWHASLVLLMPDHLHGLIAFAPDRQMKKMIGNWKEFLAKKIGIRWQRDFFDHRLRRDESYDEKASYIRKNPLRAGLIDDPAKWPYAWQPAHLIEGRAGPLGPPGIPEGMP